MNQELSANTLLSHYRVVSKIGAGGMGEVYLAEDTRLDRKVALKLLPAEFTQDQDRVRRFLREAKAASALNHPNIITIYEIGEAHPEAGGAHFLATEFIDGQTLRQQMASGPITLNVALDLTIQIASALTAAHEAGIIHRDIKPENIMRRHDGIVKVLDFGLAKLTEPQVSEVDTNAPTMVKVTTDPGTVMGTASYMLPEQARGQKLDARTDLFSLGVVLYEMIAGRPPFDSNKLRVKLSGADEQRLAKNYTENAEAYQLYLKGRFYWNKRTEKDFQKSIEYFNQAVALDPNYALAYTGLADAYTLLSIFIAIPPREGMPKAREYALKSISLDSNLADPHATLGLILTQYDYDFAGAEREYKRAIELNPNYRQAHQWYGQMLGYHGRFEEGIAETRQALESDPLSLPINWNYGLSVYYARKYDECIEQLKKTLELDNDFRVVRISLGQAYQAKGSYAECVEEYAKSEELLGEYQSARVMRESFARGGWKGFLRVMTSEPHPSNLWALICTAFHAEPGEKDKALAELNESYEARESDIRLLKVEPLFDPLRSDPRFQELVKKVGLPQ